MKLIKKVLMTELDPVSGHITNTWDVQDKTTNAPSIYLIEQVLGEISNALDTILGEEI